MDTRPIKRARIDNDWPYLFDITDLAKLVFEYVPKLQCRQLVRDSTGTLQYNICLWMPQQDIDIEIQRAILKADNVLCLHLVSLDLLTVMEYPLPNMLPCSLQHRNVDFVLPNICIPQCNLQIIAPRWTQPILRENIRELFKLKPDTERLQLLCSLLKEPLEIGDLLLVFDLHIWNTIQPFFGLLTIKDIPNTYLAAMQPDVFDVVSSFITIGERTKKLFKRSINCCNWELASLLYNEAFAENDSFKENESFKKLLFQKLSYCALYLQDKENDIWNIPDHEFQYCIGWKYKYQSVCPLLHFNSALQFANSRRNVFTKAICEVVNDLFYSFSTEHIWGVFEYACVLGLTEIIRRLWRTLPKIRQVDDPKRLLSKCRLSRDLQAIEFAWSVLETGIRNDPLCWIRSAFNCNNTVLWQFLFDKGVLTTHPCIQDSLLNHIQDFTARFHVSDLGYNSVAMLETIWNVPGVQDPTNLTKILKSAAYDANFPLLRFLNDKHVQDSGWAYNCDHSFECLDHCPILLSQIIGDYPPIYQFEMYSCVSPNVRETLWATAPLEDPIVCLQTCSHVTFDMCVFLWKKNAVDAQMLIAALKQNTHLETSTTLLDQIRAFTYCEADE